MKTFARSFLLMAFAATTFTAVSVDAQDKSKPKAPDKAKGTVEIFQDKSDHYRFRIKGDDGKTIADSVKGYEKKEDCTKALDSVKDILTSTKPVEVKKDSK